MQKKYGVIRIGSNKKGWYVGWTKTLGAAKERIRDGKGDLEEQSVVPMEDYLVIDKDDDYMLIAVKLGPEQPSLKHLYLIKRP